jgi:hypothetical protein
MATSAEDRQKAIDVLTQVMTACGMDQADAEGLAPGVIDEAIQRGQS